MIKYNEFQLYASTNYIKLSTFSIRQYEQSQFDEEKEKHSQLIGQLK